MEVDSFAAFAIKSDAERLQGPADADEDAETTSRVQRWLDVQLSTERRAVLHILEQRHKAIIKDICLFRGEGGQVTVASLSASGRSPALESRAPRRLADDPSESTPNESPALLGREPHVAETPNSVQWEKSLTTPSLPSQGPPAWEKSPNSVAWEKTPNATPALPGTEPGMAGMSRARSMVVIEELAAAQKAQGEVDSMEAVPEEPAVKLSGFQEAHARLGLLVSSARFEVIFGVLIILNTIVMAFQRQYQGMVSAYILNYNGNAGNPVEEWPGAVSVFEGFEYSFGTLFTIEVILKMIGQGRAFVKQAWNIFDFGVVACWILGEVNLFAMLMDPMVLRLARLMRLLRLLRVLRWVTILDPLHLMVKSIMSSFSTLFWALIMLVLIISVIAMTVSQLLDPFMRDKDGDRATQIQVYQAWGTFSRATETMFEITLANWGPPTRLLMNSVNEWWGLTMLLYKLTVGIAVVQIILSVFIQQTFKTAARDEEVMIKEKAAASEALMMNLNHLFEVLDTSQDGAISREEFDDVVADPRVKSWFAALEVDMGEVSRVYNMIAHGDGTISREDFIRGVKAMKGPAKGMDMLMLLQENRRNGRHLNAMAMRINVIEGMLAMQNQIQQERRQTL